MDPLKHFGIDVDKYSHNAMIPPPRSVISPVIPVTQPIIPTILPPIQSQPIMLPIPQKPKPQSSGSWIVGGKF